MDGVIFLSLVCITHRDIFRKCFISLEQISEANGLSGATFSTQ
jgi:hypothetical protein